jgi:hypothetical protein
MQKRSHSAEMRAGTISLIIVPTPADMAELKELECIMRKWSGKIAK